MSDRKNIHKLQSALSNTMDIVDTMLSVLISKIEVNEAIEADEFLSEDDANLIRECKEVMVATKEQWYPVCSEPLSEEDKNDTEL